MFEKIEEDEFAAADLPEFFGLFCEICNESEDAQDEVEDWDRRVLLNLEGLGHYWLTVVGKRFEYGEGSLDNPDTTLVATGDLAADLFIGKKDATAAYTAGSLKVEGALPDAVMLRGLIEIVREEIED